MDKQAAENLISDTFNRPFNESSFSNFIRNLLNDIDESKAFPYLRGRYIKDSFKGHIKKYRRLGTYTDPDGGKLDVLIVHLEHETALERARTMQRNFIAWYLKNRGEKDAAIVAYHSDDMDDWRFSYVRMEYKEEVTDSRKVKVKEELTPAKRYSFLVGKNEPNHTAQQQLLPLLKNDSRNPTLSELEDAFSVEAVTKQFYLDYKGLFEKLTEELDHILKKDSKIKQEFETKSIDTANFAKKLLGQIVFLYFLQKKGWLGVPKDERWGQGDKRFLRTLLKRCVTENKNFFNDYLEYLFYEALATTEGLATIDLSYYPKFDCKIPFLNGGLFEATYDWKNTNILLPDELFSNKEKTKAGDTCLPFRDRQAGTGILDIFDRYNFTVKEDEPLEKEVAVDPEMLGKVFENLLPENLRKGQGAYYTPREIVHYMCQESLINYLDTAVNTGEISLSQEKLTQQKLFGDPEPEQLSLKGTGYKTVVPRKDIEDFIHKGEFAIEHDAAKENGTTSYKYQVPESIRKNAWLLDEKLKTIKICDPAIGSGAFPVGMMHEIVKARNVLATYLSLREAEATTQSHSTSVILSDSEESQSRSAYNFKRHCIQESLYGVDIDPGAIEIAKLRLWLSLVVDEENYLNIKPLPNLDYKIMQGNSLIEDFHGISLNLEKNDELLFSENEELDLLIEGLYRKQSEFFNAIRHSDKNRLREEVEDAIIKVFHYELKRRQEQYFKELDRINKMANSFPREEDSKKCYDAEKAKLDKKYKFDFEAVENELREMTHGNKIRNFFPWKLYFADLFRKNNGFDVVIANPPYVRIQKIEKSLKQAFSQDYQSATKNYDIYVLFDEKGVDLLRPGGFFAYIQPNKFFNSDYGVGLRNFLTSNNYLYKLVNFGNSQVFDTATTYTTLLFCKKSPNMSFDYVAFSQQNASEEFLNYVSQVPSINTIQKQFSKKHITSDNWVFGDDDTLSIFKKIESAGDPLSAFTQKTFQGIVTGADPVYCLEEIDGRLWSLHLEDFVDIPFADAKPLLKGKEIRRYCTEPNKYWLIFPYSLDGHRPKLFSDKEYKSKHPEIWDYLKRCENKLRSRESSKMDHGQWYAFGRNQNLDQFEQPKLILQVLAKKASITLDESNNYYFVGGGNAGGYGITLKDGSYLSYKYLLGLLNSTLLDFYLQKHSSMFQNGYYSYAKRFIEKVPIVEVSKAEQEPIISLVDQILSLKKSDPQAATSTLETEIDRMVYELYDLTAEEIDIVERSARRR